MTILAALGVVVVAALVTIGARSAAGRVGVVLVGIFALGPTMLCWIRCAVCAVPPSATGVVVVATSIVVVVVAVVRFVQHRRALARFVGSPHSGRKRRVEES